MNALVIVLVVVAILFVIFRFVGKRNSEENLMVERFKARFDVNPHSTKAHKLVARKLTQLRSLAAYGTTDDIKELELALKVAKQYGFAQ